MKKLMCACVLAAVVTAGFSQIPLNVVPVNPAPIVNPNPITASASGIVSGTNAAIILSSLSKIFDTGALLSSNHVVMISANLMDTNGNWFVTARFCAGTNSTVVGRLASPLPKK